MEKNFEPPAAIKFSYKAGFTAAEMWDMFVKPFGDSSMSRATVFRWHSLFVASKESIEDAEQSGRSGTTKMKKPSLRWQLF